MKNFILKRPFLTSVIAFSVIFLGGIIAGIILGLVAMGYSEPCQVNDVCDGGAMAAGAIWSLSFIASLVLAVIVSLLLYLFIKFKTRVP